MVAMPKGPWQGDGAGQEAGDEGVAHEVFLLSNGVAGLYVQMRGKRGHPSPKKVQNWSFIDSWMKRGRLL